MTDPRRREVVIDGRRIGSSFRPYVIAEISANHSGDLDLALAIMRAAKEAGADAVKLQTYTADTMTIDLREPPFLIEEGLWQGQSLYELYEKAHTPWDWHERLFAEGRKLGITVFSTPFDETAVDFLAQFDPPAYKIASFEMTDHVLLEKVAQTGKPMIVSTGMASLAEIERAVRTITDAGCEEFILMHCVSGYPTPVEDINLATIQDLRTRFDCVVGLSDHTTGSASSVAAVALGAAAIEKHVTIDRNDGGFDAAFSLEPHELISLCADCSAAWSAIGSAGYNRKPSEDKSVSFRRSIFVVEDVEAGEVFSEQNVRRIRPGNGLPADNFHDVLGARSKRMIPRGTPLTWDMIDHDGPNQPNLSDPQFNGRERERTSRDE